MTSAETHSHEGAVRAAQLRLHLMQAEAKAGADCDALQTGRLGRPTALRSRRRAVAQHVFI